MDSLHSTKDYYSFCLHNIYVCVCAVYYNYDIYNILYIRTQTLIFRIFKKNIHMCVHFNISI